MTDTTLDEMMKKTPVQITRDDLEAVVRKSRSDRGLWEVKKETAAKRKALKKEKEDA